MTEYKIEQSDNGTIERKIVTGLITSTDFIQAILPIYQPQLLGEIPRKVAGWALKFHDKHGKKAPLEHIQTVFQLEKGSMQPDLAALVEMFLASISKEYEGQGDFNLSFAVDMAAKYFSQRGLEMLRDDLEYDLEGGNLNSALDRVAQFKAVAAPKQALGRGYSGPELLKARFPEPRWIVKDLLPQGFTMLGGPPKVGKSWMALNLALAIATGGRFLERYGVEEGEALFLDFELPDTKLKNRLKVCLNGRHDLPGLENLHLQPKGSWPRIHEGGLEMLEDFVKEHPGLKLVVIDVWRRFSKPRKAQEENSYNLTYEDVGPVKDFADNYGICVLANHHLAKGWRSYQTPFEALLGSTALAGASDNLLALVKGQEKADGVLWSTGRDIEESRNALEFVKESCTWKFLGDARQYELTVDQNAIVQALSDRGEPLSPKEIALAVGRPAANVSEMLRRMIKQGRVEQEGYGKYKIPTISTITTITNITPISPITSPSKEDESYRGYRGYRGFNGGVTYRPSPINEDLKWYGPEILKELSITAEHSWRMCMAIQDEIRRGDRC